MAEAQNQRRQQATLLARQIAHQLQECEGDGVTHVTALLQLNVLARMLKPQEVEMFFLPNFDVNLLKPFLTTWDPSSVRYTGFLSIRALKLLSQKAGFPMRFETYYTIVQLYGLSAEYFCKHAYNIHPCSYTIYFFKRSFEAVTSLIANCINGNNVCPHYLQLSKNILNNMLKVNERFIQMKLGTLAFWQGPVQSHNLCLRTLMGYSEFNVACESQPIIAHTFVENGGVSLLLEWLAKTSGNKLDALPFDIHMTILVVLFSLVKMGHARALCKNRIIDILLKYARRNHLSLIIQTAQSDVQIMLLVISIFISILSWSSDTWKDIVIKDGIEIFDSYIPATEPTKSKARRLVNLLKERLYTWKTQSAPHLPNATFVERYRETRKKYSVPDLVTELVVITAQTSENLPAQSNSSRPQRRKRKLNEQRAVSCPKRNRKTEDTTPNETSTSSTSPPDPEIVELREKILCIQTRLGKLRNSMSAASVAMHKTLTKLVTDRLRNLNN